MIKTINVISFASFKINRSEFIGFLYPVSDVTQIKEILSEHNNKYRDATHNCYAYVLGKKQETQYYSDQGEPSGTAGKPILNAMLKHNLTFTLAIVTRYFGGVKLGVRGLIDTYTEATELVINKAELINYRPVLEINVQCEYNTLEQIKHSLRSLESEFVVGDYSEAVTGKIIYPEDMYNEIHSLIADLTQKRLLTVFK